MKIEEAIRVSFRALTSNLVRSMLTTLGIIIGVAAVITMVALTNGAKNLIEEQLVGLGGNTLIVSPGQRAASGVLLNPEGESTLTEKDAQEIKSLPIVRHVSPILDTADQVVWGNRSWFTTIVGVSPDFAYINDWFPTRGTFINEADVDKAALVCVLGRTVAEKLFGYLSPIGSSIRIGTNYCTVAGVLAPKGQTPSGKDQDDVVFVPYTTFQRYIKRVRHVENIAVSVRSPDEIPIAERQIAGILRESRRLSPTMEDDFYIRSQQHVTERIFSISRIMTILLASIASVSLVVGGIGIMNIMLVSVTERTKEIGIRLAVGAKQRDIMTQFLIEAVLLSVIGGIAGILVGVIASKLSSVLTGWPTLISASSVIIAFGFSATVGIFFGLYPAAKASKLDPIVALRYE